MSDIKQTYEIAASPEDVWRALTEPEVIRVWSSADAVFPLNVGSAYSLWDGGIGGEIVEVVPLQKLVQTWKPVEWTRQDSVVTFWLSPAGDGTRVDLLHTNVEDFDYDGTNEGWDIYYLGAIKKMLEARSAGRPLRGVPGAKSARGGARGAKSGRIAKATKGARSAKTTKGVRSAKPTKGAKAAKKSKSARGGGRGARRQGRRARSARGATRGAKR